MLQPMAKRSGVLATSWRKPPSRIAGHEQHQHGADRDLRRLPAVQREIVEPAVAARKQHLLGDHAGRRAANRIRAPNSVVPWIEIQPRKSTVRPRL